MSDETHRVGEHEITLGVPASYSIRIDVLTAAGQHAQRAFAAALAVCWRGKGRPTVKLSKYRFDVLSFGGGVIDELTARGVPYQQIVEVGGLAWVALSEATEIPTEDEVDDQANFIEVGVSSTG